MREERFRADAGGPSFPKLPIDHSGCRELWLHFPGKSPKGVLEVMQSTY